MAGAQIRAVIFDLEERPVLSRFSRMSGGNCSPRGLDRREAELVRIQFPNRQYGRSTCIPTSYISDRPTSVPNG